MDYFSYAKQYLASKYKDENYVIEGNSKMVAGINLDILLDLNFTDNIYGELVFVYTTDFLTPGKMTIESNNTKTLSETPSYKNMTYGALNTVVKSNNGDDWNNKKYIVITPFKDIKSKICAMSSSNTFYMNEVSLCDNSIVLVDEKYKHKLTEEELKMNIIFYRGNKEVALYKAIIMMGYKPQRSTSYELYNSYNDENIEKYRKKKGYDPGLNSYEIYKKIEQSISKRDNIISRIRKEKTNTCENKNFNVLELDILIKEKVKEFSDLKIVEFLLNYGIDFNDTIPYFLNIYQTTYRAKRYYNDEKKQYIFHTDEDIKQYPELVKLLQNYKRTIKFKNDIKKAYYENYIISKKIKNISTSELNNIDYIKDYIERINNALASKKLSVIYNGTSITLNNLDGNIEFLFKKDLFPDKKILNNDSILIRFDLEENLINNLKQSIVEIEDIIETLEKNSLIKIDENTKNQNK